MFRALRPRGPLDSPADLDGAALETLFLQEIRALNDSLGLSYDLHYWRSASGLEVDLVLYGERGLRAFEIKRASRLGGRDFKGLQAFLEDYPEAEGFLAYGGRRAFREGRIRVLPAEACLRELTKLI